MKLYAVQLRVTVPSLSSMRMRWLAIMGKWQPKQLVVHELWQGKQVMRLSECGRLCRSEGRLPQALPSFKMVFARRDCSLKCGAPGVMVSFTCTTSHSTFWSMEERWYRRLSECARLCRSE